MSNWRAGDTLVSTLDSVVYAVGYTMNDGNYVVLQKGKVLAFYAHLKDTSVKPGDKISTGTVIGHIGNTGTSTAPHLHYGIFICDDSVIWKLKLLLNLQIKILSSPKVTG